MVGMRCITEIDRSPVEGWISIKFFNRRLLPTSVFPINFSHQSVYAKLLSNKSLLILEKQLLYGKLLQSYLCSSSVHVLAT